VSRDFVGALLQLNAEKGVSREQLIRTVEEAIQSAYRRSPGDEDINVRIDGESGKVRVFRARLVVEEIDDPLTQMTVDEAQAVQPGAEVGDLVETEQLDQEAFGRIHAQTAKQVVLQRLHEAERNVVFDEYASREGELITGTVSRVEPRAIVLDVGKAEAILATTEQSPLEHYRIGQNVKAYVLEVRRSAKGPQIYISRTHKGFLRRLFELEVPEIHAGTVEVRSAVETLDRARTGAGAVRRLVRWRRVSPRGGWGSERLFVILFGLVVAAGLFFVVLVVPVVLEAKSDLQVTPKTHSNLLVVGLSAEDGATNANDGRPLFDGHTKVVGHTHRKLM